MATQAAFLATLLACVATFFLDLNINSGGTLSLTLETDLFLWALGLALLALLSVGNYVQNRRRAHDSYQTTRSSPA